MTGGAVCAAYDAHSLHGTCELADREGTPRDDESEWFVGQVRPQVLDARVGAIRHILCPVDLTPANLRRLCGSAAHDAMFRAASRAGVVPWRLWIWGPNSD